MSAENLKIIKFTWKIDWFDWTHQIHADESTALYGEKIGKGSEGLAVSNFFD